MDAMSVALEVLATLRSFPRIMSVYRVSADADRPRCYLFSTWEYFLVLGIIHCGDAEGTAVDLFGSDDS